MKTADSLLGGMAREVLDLNFEGAPPISIVAPKFKEKPKLPFKPRRWYDHLDRMRRSWTDFGREQSPFMNSARKDGLILHHWKREGDTTTNITGLPVTPADSNAASEMDTDDKGASVIDDSRAAKWNVRIDRPQYSDEEYASHLRDDDWSREETDYLMNLATDYDLRWVVIGDRYDYKLAPATQDESPDAMAIDRPPSHTKSRTTEDLKARYYTITAKCMTLRTPLSSMNPTEFESHEKMTKFDPKRETLRKQYAEKLFLRTPEEAHEEELLLKELSRIVINQEKLYQERKALYERLEAPRPMNSAAAHASTTVYQSSQGLQQLMQSMMQSQRMRESERREKRRSALGIDTENANNHAIVDSRGQRSSLGSASATQDRRQSHPTPQHRPLTHAERAKFGVAYPQERLTSGVQFRHERVMKASQAKSAVQTTRINDALAELGIPPRLLMPTNKVVTEYERLVEGVKSLVEVRKLREKVDGEIKVWEAQRNLANGDGAGDEPDAETAKAEDADAEGEEEENQDEQKEDDRADSEDENEEPKVNDDEDDDEEEEEEEEEEEAVAGENGHIADAEDREENEEDEENDDADADADFGNQEEAGDQDAEGSDASQDGEQEDEEDNNDEADNDSPDAEIDRADGDETAEGEDTGGDDAASARVRSMRKRSASVMSAISNKSSKRQRK